MVLGFALVLMAARTRETSRAEAGFELGTGWGGGQAQVT